MRSPDPGAEGDDVRMIDSSKIRFIDGGQNILAILDNNTYNGPITGAGSPSLMSSIDDNQLQPRAGSLPPGISLDVLSPTALGKQSQITVGQALKTDQMLTARATNR